MWCDGGYMILTFFGDLVCRVSPVVCLEFGGDGMDLAIVASLVIDCFDSQHLCLSLKQRPKQSECNGICSEKVRHFMWSLRIAIFQCLKVLDCQLASHLLLHNVFYWRSTSLRVLKRKHTCHQLMSLYILSEQLDRRPTIFVVAKSLQSLSFDSCWVSGTANQKKANDLEICRYLGKLKRNLGDRYVVMSVFEGHKGLLCFGLCHCLLFP